MRTKRVAAVSLITFMLGGVSGAAYAFVTHATEDGQIALPAAFEQAQENKEVEQFIDEQEELHPQGLKQSKIETGSKYNGITYNNVGTATVHQKNTDVPDTQNVVDQNTEQDNVQEDEKKDEKGGLFSRIFGKKDKDDEDKEEKTVTNSNSNTTQGRIVVQNGSLNIRAKGELNGKVIGQVYKGDTVQILGEEGSWYQIVTKDGLQGYVSATYVEKLSEGD